VSDTGSGSPAPERVTISYEMPADELARTLWRRVVLRPRYLQSIGFFAIVGLLAVASGGALVGAGYVLLVYAVSRPFVIRGLLTRTVRTSSIAAGPRSAEFGPSGVVMTGFDWSVRLPWRHFKGWGEDATNFYLETTESGLGSVIPKRAMTDAQQLSLRGFFETIPAQKK